MQNNESWPKGNYIAIALSLLVILAASLTSASASAPRSLNIQGKLTYPNGSAITANNYNFTFRIYDAFSGGTKLWEENLTLNVSKGIYDAVLGNTTAINITFDRNY